MEGALGAAGKLVGKGYIEQGCGSLQTADNAITHLIEQRRLPEIGWTDLQIERLMAQLAMMDSNNFIGTLECS